MGQPTKPGQIIILNGAPRSGKSSIVTAIQETFEGLWMNLGVDVFVTQVTPRRYRPGMGLRPGEEGHKLAPLVPALYAAMYESIAAHSRAELNVVVDVGHHDRTRENAAEDIRGRAAEPHPAARATITRDRAPAPRECGAGGER